LDYTDFIMALFDPDSSNQILRGYRLKEILGSGGFGAVYRAYQASIDREVAVKVIKPNLANDPSFIQRFEREAQIIARLEHPHIVPLYDYWREPDGAYLVMRLMRGGSLHDLLHAERLELDEVLRILHEIGDALDGAHRKGVIHRDVKPRNVMLDEERRVYLADFGLASDEQHKDADREDGMISGSPFYMSPEQASGGLVTPQSDLYSTGVMLFEMLTGVVPFGDTLPSTALIKHMTEPLPDLKTERADLSDAINLVIQKATAKNPAERYQSAQEMAEAFASAIATTARPADKAPVAIDNPYKGLRAFQEDDASDFYGREALIDQMIGRLRSAKPQDPRFLAVIGPSGSGKSSAVRAGLIPAMRAGSIPASEKWLITDLFPGGQPFENLADAILRISIRPLPNLLERLHSGPAQLLQVISEALPADPKVRLVIVIDQFEEIFTMTTKDEERKLFLDNLLSAVMRPGRTLIIVTLRADFFDQPLLYPRWGELFRDHAQIVLPLNETELRSAIELPALRAGLLFEPGLIDQIIRDVRDQPGALPLLQYALTELFERRDANRLINSAYRELGGVTGALARRAEQLYETLTAAGREAVRQVFMRLVALGEGTEDTRRRVPHTELVPAPTSETAIAHAGEMDYAISIYTRYRLLTADRDPQDRSPTVEVAHEALIRTWSRLKEWIKSSREDLRLQRKLTAAALEWHTHQRDQSYLAAGTRLSQFEALTRVRDLSFNQLELEYVHASITERTAQEEAERERQQRELAAARKLAETEKQRAEERAQAAESLRKRAVILTIVSLFAGLAALAALFLAQLANRTADENIIIASTAQAANTQIVEEMRGRSTQQAIAESNFARAESQRLAAEANSLLQRHESPELAALLALRGLQTAYTEQAEIALERAARFDYGSIGLLHSDSILRLALSPDGRTLATGDETGVTRLWDVNTGTMLNEFKDHTDGVQAISFSPDGKLLLTGSYDFSVILRDAQSGAILQQPEAFSDSVNWVGFSPDGKIFAASSDEGVLRLYNTDNGETIAELQHTEDEYPSCFVFDPQGQTVLIGMYNGAVVRWDYRSGETIQSYEGAKDIIWSLEISPDGKQILATSNDLNALIWNLAGGELIHRFKHTDSIYDARFSPDGTLIATGGVDTNVWLWDVESETLLRRFGAHTSSIYSLVFLPDGDHLISGSTDGTARVWDLTKPVELDTLKEFDLDVYTIAYSHDRRHLAAGGGNARLVMWNAATLEYEREFKTEYTIYTAVFSKDDQRILTASDDGAIVWDALTGEQLLTLYQKDNAAYSALFSPDDKTILVAESDYNLYLYDAQTGDLLQTFSGHEFGSVAVFAKDGKTIVTGGEDKTIRIWDAASGAQLRTIDAPDQITSIALAPDGRTLAIGGSDPFAYLFDLETGEQLHQLIGHTNAIWSIAFSPDGNYVLTASQDKTARIWDVRTGNSLRVIPSHANSGLFTAIFSPDGKRVALGSFDGALVLAYTNLNDAIQSVCQRILRDLTDQQRTTYGIGNPAPTCP
jgi:WD40 repeat protein/serine/threonine protein kinase